MSARSRSPVAEVAAANRASFLGARTSSKQNAARSAPWLASPAWNAAMAELNVTVAWSSAGWPSGSASSGANRGRTGPSAGLIYRAYAALAAFGSCCPAGVTRCRRPEWLFVRHEAHNQCRATLAARPFGAVPVRGVRAAPGRFVKLLEQLLRSASGTVPGHLAHLPVTSFGATCWGLRSIVARRSDIAREVARRVRDRRPV